ncbi:hypothetical protein KFK09_008319 [Dendrobium nobile]|uniref:HMA domain-containing protein n=1 Tax=Dendrobium nobile TaxID=94219 RepID=A0A8T3BQL0_DENNO|nr:hypothetical protein KFK09_008319 [Dendrobium nobile]
MTKDGDFKLLKIQTVNLKVNLHCDGCKQNVKKILQKIEGVYTVTIDSEKQKVAVSGNVDSATLIKKLAKSGKHSELLNQKPNNSTNNQNHKPNNNPQSHQYQSIKDNPSKKNNGNVNINNNKPQATQPLLQGLKAFKNQQTKLDSFSSDDEFSDEDDEDDLNFIGHKLNLLKQANPGTNAKKNGKKEGGSKSNHDNGGMMKNLNCSELKDYMNGTTNNKVLSNPTTSNGIMGFGALQGLNKGFPSTVTNFNGSHGNPSSIMMNPSSLYSNGNMQPQVMYNRSPQIPPYTGFYSYPYYYNINNYNNSTSHQSEDYGAYNYSSDEDRSSCAVM